MRIENIIEICEEFQEYQRLCYNFYFVILADW